MNEHDLDYAGDMIRAIQWRSRRVRKLMDTMFDEMTPEEVKGAESAKVNLTYDALRVLDEQAGELKEAIQQSQPYMWETQLDEWRDCARVVAWCDASADRQLALLEAIPDRNESLLDRMTLVAAATECMLTEVTELERILRAVLLNDGAPVDPVDPVEPGEMPEDTFDPTDSPEGVNPIVWALDQMNEARGPRVYDDPTEELHVQIPAGAYKGVAVGARSWSPLARYEPWWGAAKMHIWGRGVNVTTIIPVHDQRGWGASFEIQPNEDWDGRLVLHDMTIQCSGANAIQAGAYGTQEMRPLRDLGLERVVIADHPNEDVWCTRPISLNQAAFTGIGVLWECYRSKEHGVYRRNGLGQLALYSCAVHALGGQVIQDVSRRSEGPDYGPGCVVTEDCDFQGFHRHPSRAGSAITVAGSGCELLMHRTTIRDINRQIFPPLDGLRSHGAVVVWKGGDSWPTESGRSNISATIVECDFIMHNGDRAVLSFDDVDEVRVVGCGVYSSNGRPVTIGSHGEGSVGKMLVKACNTAEVRDRILKKGLPVVELVNAGRVEFGPDREMVGGISEVSTVGF